MSICDVAVALAVGAASAVDVEAEVAGRVVVRAGLDRVGKHGADLVEGLEVGDRIAARRSADRALVDQNHVVDLPVAQEIVQRQRLGGVLAHAAAEGRVERVLDQRALARAADAGDQAEHAQRELDGDVLEVVAARAGQSDPAVVGRRRLPDVTVPRRPAR